jgi:predicted RNA-binding Zn-ribbon protein involved in translation (DUF1610 family)
MEVRGERLLESMESTRFVCPICGDDLVPLAHQRRCRRCGLLLCEDCEGEAPSDDPDG